jgi:hypothetical protein
MAFSFKWRKAAPVLALVLTGGAVSLFTLSSRLPAQQEKQATEEAPEPAPYEARKLCDLQDPRINESSGIGASRRYSGFFWTHNDSGDGARLFLINSEGKTLTTVHLKGANSVDWEDMAVAGDKEKSWVYVGDIGDNLEARDFISIYRFREPEVNLDNPPEQLTIEPERMNLLYPDKSHNAETLMADLTGRLLIVTKSLEETLVFQTPESWKAGGKQKLEKLGKITLPEGFRRAQTTGGDISHDGKRLVVMTYAQMHEWHFASWLKDGGAQWRQMIEQKPRTWELPKAKQMEAVCYGLDDKLYSTSEQLPAPLWEYMPRK